MKTAARKKTAVDVEALLDEMAARIAAQIADTKREDIVIIGIRTGGVWVADGLRTRLKIKTPTGALNIAYHRDDFARKGLHPSVDASDLPFAIDDRHVILVDDILFTGRTVRAALNEIFDFGRPASVKLVVLVDRGGRELPIEPNVAGMQMSLSAHEHVKLTGPEPLALTLQKSA